MGKESEAFEDLAKLTATPGFAHALAYLCVQENYIVYSESIDVPAILSSYSDERTIRTEMSTLIGLMAKNDLDVAMILLDPRRPPGMASESIRLLKELHVGIDKSAQAIFGSLRKTQNENPFAHAEVLREPIFYGGESAYMFQYRDFARQRYQADKAWLTHNKGFDIEQAHAVVKAVCRHQQETVVRLANNIRWTAQSDRTLLPAFTFTTQDITQRTSLSEETIRNVLKAFSLPYGDMNSAFSSVGDYNATNALPIFPLDCNRYLLYQCYSLCESLYESPMYWMLRDETYKDTHAKNRGAFLEGFCGGLFKTIFGDQRVFQNVSLRKGKSFVGEIDALVLFSDRALLVQTKAKRLTIQSRKGNDNQIRKDFQLAVQDAYDQGFSCASFLADGAVTLLTQSGAEIRPRLAIKEVLLMCVSSEHYPALAFQVRQFLRTQKTQAIPEPLVLDVFSLDAIAEMLPTPLYFLSYIKRRIEYSGRIHSAQELTVLSYHLKKNLWIDAEFDAIHLHDDIGADLDIAMLARRDNMPGAKTPDGILTRIPRTHAGSLLKQIEFREEPASIEFGFFVLTMSEDALQELGNGMQKIAQATLSDKKHHDYSMGFNAVSSGITLHSNLEDENESRAHLIWHCERRKYLQKARQWFGVSIKSTDASIRFGCHLDYPWVQSAENEKRLNIANSVSTSESGAQSTARKSARPPRNSPCPCGSGRKFKNCCLQD